MSRPVSLSDGRGRRCTDQPTSELWSPAPHSRPYIGRNDDIFTKTEVWSNVLVGTMTGSSSHQFPHVGGSWLRSFLPLGHLSSQLVVFGQDGNLGRGAELSEDCLTGTGGGGALVVNMISQSQSCKYIFHKVKLFERNTGHYLGKISF